MSNVRQLSFSGGEIAPALYARVDMVKYATGLKKCENFMVMRHGGVTNRPGTKFVAEVKDSSKAVRLIPFVFNNTQTYVLEFGDLYMRVHRNGAQELEATKTITAATQASPCVITSTAHGYLDGEEAAIASVGGMTQLNGRNFKIANKTANTFELQYMDGTNVDSTAFGAYTSGGTAARVYTITTPYLEADLPTLQFIQSADIITLTHPTYTIRELARTGHTTWTLTAITFAPQIAAPTGLTAASPGTTEYVKVTTVDAETNEESLPSAAVGSTTSGDIWTWNTVAGAGHYNIYRRKDSQYGWVGISGVSGAPGEQFADNAAYVPDPLDTPPVDRQPFNAVGDYPSTCAYYQQRLVFANTDNNPEGAWTSKSALPKNMMVSTPLQDDDAVTFSLAGRQVNEIHHLLDIGKLIMFTASGEWVIEGDTAGVLTPTGINPQQHSANGSGTLPPLVVDGTALYVQARGSIVRDLGYEFESDGYKGNELSIFAAHMFDNYTLADWTYQQIPHSVVWAARSDGVLLGLTYVREHQVFGWHRHIFTNGTIENTCVVPEGTKDSLYVVVKRTIDGNVVRYIEQMQSRQFSNVVDAIFMDSALSYDGRNTGATTMTLSGGTTWGYDEDLTLTASVAYFVAGDVGNQIWLTDSAGEDIRATITAFTSTTVVTVRSNRTVPAILQGVAVTVWSKAVASVGGLWHLEGQNVSVFVDGTVSANPNNDDYTVRTVTNGTITLDDPHAVIHAGLPITAEIETLAIDSVQGQSMADKRKHVSKLTVSLESTRGLWAGPDEDNLTEFKLRNEEGYDDPTALATGIEDINVRSRWSGEGNILIRQTDPLPASILAVVPGGFIAAP